MQKINYVKIQNFKVFGEEIHINLDTPTILIGANNSGKTTVIQALALWSWSLKIWTEKKKNTKSQAERNKGVALNRLEIAQVPIKEARYFWNSAKVRQNSNENIGLTIKVGFDYQGGLHEVGMLFKYHSPDLIYCQPTEESFLSTGIIEYAQSMKINLLYPMSGISEKEFVFQEEAIKTQIGLGQTSNVLRNICYYIYTTNKEDWSKLKDIMKTLFSVELIDPYLRATGVIELLYNYSDKSKKTDYDLDITLAGRGQQQMLLVLAYLLSNKNSLLMIDEPDAHLEILRQTQIFTILREISDEFGSQIIIVTHSEVVLNESSSVNFIVDGKVDELSDKNQFKKVRYALNEFGIEHYYKAKINPRILYIESSTDKEILLHLAIKQSHKLRNILGGKLNYYYTQNDNYETSVSNTLEIRSGANKPVKRHFDAISSVINDFKGIGIFDSDNKGRIDEVNDNLAIVYWKSYEIENYFINPSSILSFAKEYYLELYGNDSLFSDQVEGKLRLLQEIINESMVLHLLNGDRQALADFINLPNSIQIAQFGVLNRTSKMSQLLEETFDKFSFETKTPLILRKGEFYKLINYNLSLAPEINEKLDLIYNYLSINP